MADKSKNNLPKVPPFIIPGASNQYEEKPTSQAAHVVQAPKSTVNNDKQAAQKGMFGSLILLISVLSLGVAMISGAWFAYGVLGSDAKDEEKSAEQTGQPQEGVPPQTADSGNKDSEDTIDAADSNNILPKVIVVGLTFAVGWIFSAIGVRSMGNLLLPYAIQVYTWVVLGGIILLQVLIMVRLYRQEYQFFNYMKYLSLFGAGLVALVCLHLLLEKHSLVSFGFIMLLASLGHLYTIVYHYIFETEVIYSKVWGDVIFFLVTTLVSILMMVHLGLLNGARRLIDRMFTPKDNHFVS